MSPTACFSPGSAVCGHGDTEDGSGEGVPGVWDDGWLGGYREGVLPGYYPARSQDPYLVIIQPEALPTAK